MISILCLVSHLILINPQGVGITEAQRDGQWEARFDPEFDPRPHAFNHDTGKALHD